MKGKVIKLGMCQKGYKKPPKNVVIQDNTNTQHIKGDCMVKKGAYVTRVNINASTNMNYDNKLKRL